MIDLWDSLARTISALAVVLLLMGLVAWGARRVLGSRGTLSGATPLVQVLANTYLAPRKSIALVSIAGEYLIVGMTATDLVPLGRIDDQQKVQTFLADSARSGNASLLAPSTAGPATWLQHLADTLRQPKKGSHDE